MSSFTFGKFKHIPIKDVFQQNYYYIDWISKQSWFQTKFKEQYVECRRLLDERKGLQLSAPPNQDDIIIYTDGACSKNGTSEARAGIGIHFSNKNTYKFDDVSQELHVKHPTNNVAELTAILTAINLVKHTNNKIIIYTDSEYCILCIKEWYDKWFQAGTLNQRKHIDLIGAIHKLYHHYDISLIHIHAHTGNKDEHSLGNQQADYLARISLRDK